MAKVRQRTWSIPGQRTKRKAWGFTVVIDGKRTKHYRAEWTRQHAENALAEQMLKIESAKPTGAGMTLAEAAERYLGAKSRKRSISEDRRLLEHLKSEFGSETRLSDLTASRISQYKADRLNAVSGRTNRPLTAASINRPLAVLRHLLRVASEEWEVLEAAPKIRLEREAQGRVRWLEPAEEARLLAACAGSQNRQL